MKITFEQIIDALKDNAELRNQLLSNFSNIEGGKELIEKANKIYFDEKFGSEISKIYNAIDDDIFAVTGKRKKADQKTYDFLKDELKDLKTKADGAKEPEDVKILQDKIKELQSKIDNGESSDHWKKSYNEIKDKFAEAQNDFTKKLKQLEDDNFKTRIESEIESAASGLKFNKSFPDSVVKIMIETAKKDLLNSAKIVDNKVVYFDSEGKPIRDNMFNEKTSKDIISERLKDIIEVGPTHGGKAPVTSGKGVVLKTEDAKGEKINKLSLDKEAFSTRLGFMKLAESTLLENGIAKGSKEYDSLILEARKELEVDKLPRE